MILIVGLGNPGKKYEDTRHNIGFMVVDGFLKKMTSVKDSVWEEDKKFNSLIAKIDEDIILAKPQSFMNASGPVVAKLMNFYKIKPCNLYLTHDDVDLPLGKIKITIDRGSAGHKGVESVINAIGSQNFVRIRVGVGRDSKIAMDRFVLMPFAFGEKGKLSRAVKKAVEALETVIKEGPQKAANKYNQ